MVKKDGELGVPIEQTYGDRKKQNNHTTTPTENMYYVFYVVICRWLQSILGKIGCYADAEVIPLLFQIL